MRTDAGAEFFLIDLDQARIGRTLTLRQRIANLVEFNRFFASVAARTQRAQFLRGYADFFPDVAKRRREIARKIEEKTARSLKSLFRSHDRRCLGENRYFARLKVSGTTWLVRRKVLDGDMRKVLEDPMAAFRKGVLRIPEEEKASLAARLGHRIEQLSVG